MPPKPPVIFPGFSNDKQMEAGYLRNLTRERYGLRAALEIVAANDNAICELVVENDLIVDGIFDVFQNEKYCDRIAIFHYWGHFGWVDAGSHVLLNGQLTGTYRSGQYVH